METIMYRPEIKVLDCSIRDGGLINKWQFSDEFVRQTYIACVAAGIDYMEIGYKASAELFDPKEYGKWRFCKDEDIQRTLDGIDLTCKLACMVDIGRVEEKDLLPQEKSPFSLIRVASYVKDIDKAIDLAKLVQDKGYETCINIMAVSTNLEKDIDEALEQLAKTDVPSVYVVDSYGNMFSEDVTFLVKKYQKFLPGKTIGIHTHNNRQLAFANTIQAIIDGANFIDASMFGIGRGPGNCPMELLLGFLKNPKFNQRPVIQCVQEVFLPLRQKIDWGYSVPYAITGQLNEHPRDAIKLRESERRDEFVAFYDEMNE